MSTLHLVRHGQASAHLDDYDQLSPLGEEQTKRLGRWWAKDGPKLDAIYTGPLKRQRDTATRFLEGSGYMDKLALVVLEGLAEVDVQPFFVDAFRRVTPMCPDLKERMANRDMNDEAKEALRCVSGIVKRLLWRWGHGDDLKVEPFIDFQRRVRDSLHGIMSDQREGKEVMVITSSGPIAIGLQLALKSPIEPTLNIMSGVKNASVSRLYYAENELAMSAFNTLPHLDDPDLRTMV